ncbi:MAG: cell division protein FtsQ/DivIB [Gallionella sp.]
MWDSHKILTSFADALISISVILVLYGVTNYVVHLPGLLPLNTVQLEKPMQQVSNEEVLQAAKAGAKGNLLTVDIEQVKKSLEEMPWVRKADIRREFPDRLAINLEEQQALARWNKQMLVNHYGEVFSADTDLNLPEFFGPDGTSTEVAIYFDYFSKQLAMIDLYVEKINLTSRYAWQLSLTNGVVLELGREDLEQRMARFVEAYFYSLAAEQGRFKYVDLRYRNGFAVGGLARQG